MANDRLYIKCVCGDGICIAKWWGWDFQFIDYDGRPEWWSKWLTQHEQCFVNPDLVDPPRSFGDGDPLFTLSTEGDPTLNPIPFPAGETK
jgi:hypothetical protein